MKSPTYPIENIIRKSVKFNMSHPLQALTEAGPSSVNVLALGSTIPDVAEISWKLATPKKKMHLVRSKEPGPLLQREKVETPTL